MPRCNHCETDHRVEDLVRHETEGCVRVHCPDCSNLLGTYRDPARTPGANR